MTWTYMDMGWSNYLNPWIAQIKPTNKLINTGFPLIFVTLQPYTNKNSM